MDTMVKIKWRKYGAYIILRVFAGNNPEHLSLTGTLRFYPHEWQLVDPMLKALAEVEGVEVIEQPDVEGRVRVRRDDETLLDLGLEGGEADAGSKK